MQDVAANEMLTVIEPTEEMGSFRIRRDRTDRDHMALVARRWLERNASRKGRYVNRPSSAITVTYNPLEQRGLLIATASSFPQEMGAWLQDMKVTKETITIQRQETW